MIYHYTTIEAFNSILDCYKKSESKDNLIFWASSIYQTNDPTEMRYGLTILKNNLLIYEEEQSINNNIRLSAFLKEKSEHDELGFWNNYFYNEKKMPFIISFSCNEDFLPMWSMYAKNGTGLCLCFDKEEIHIENKELIATPLLSTLYINQKKNDPLTEKFLIESINDEYQSYLKERVYDDYTKMTHAGTLLTFVSSFIKHNSYAYEREKRIILYAKDTTSSVLFRTSKQGNIIPYVRVPIPIKNLKEIIIGPNINPQYIKTGLSMALKSCNLNPIISLSRIPYRQI